MRVQLVEPFFGGSHRAWAEGWRDHSRHEIDLLTMPPAAWRWRMRGAAVSLAPLVVERARTVGVPDLLVASDMIDLSALLALVRRELGPVPVALYLHENQLTYPRRPGEPLDTGLAWTTWGNLVVADAIWCNSAFHRHELCEALPALLASVPDHDHLAHLPAVRARMEVLPVGVHVDRPSRPHADAEGGRTDPPLIVSNQRWHHDKDIAALARALVRLADSGLAFRVAFVGDEHGGEADTVHPLLDRLGDRVVARGLLPRADYEALLDSADIVVPAARNEFFGIAVVEAVAAGLLPVLPAGLAYRETIPAAHHDQVLYEPGDLQGAIARAVVELETRRAAVDGLAASMRRFDWAVVAPRYDRAVDDLVEAGGPVGR